MSGSLRIPALKGARSGPRYDSLHRLAIAGVMPALDGIQSNAGVASGFRGKFSEGSEGWACKSQGFHG
ncbi:MAG: hypothetical protein EG828_12215 [Deltaproteobacteria bacterium]|nr:hypothetical protein [Deltaproteobacteria bacterium]